MRELRLRQGGQPSRRARVRLLFLTDTLIAILEAAKRGGFDVRFRWVKRELVQDADNLSKFVDRMDFSLGKRGSSASPTRAEAVDALAQDWGLDRSYMLPDFYAVGKVLDHIERSNAIATLIVPEWPAEQWWHRIWSGAR